MFITVARVSDERNCQALVYIENVAMEAFYRPKTELFVRRQEPDDRALSADERISGGAIESLNAYAAHYVQWMRNNT